MKSLHTRLDPQKEEVLKVTETFGPFRAMAMFKVADYPGFRRWLKDVTKNENFGLHPKISLNSGQTLGDQLVVAFLQKVADLEAENERLGERLKFVEWQLSHSKETEDQQALAILEVCQA